MRDGPVGFSALLGLRGCFQAGEQLGQLPAKFFRVGDLGLVGSQVFQQARHVVAEKLTLVPGSGSRGRKVAGDEGDACCWCHAASRVAALHKFQVACSISLRIQGDTSMPEDTNQGINPENEQQEEPSPERKSRRSSGRSSASRSRSRSSSRSQSRSRKSSRGARASSRRSTSSTRGRKSVRTVSRSSRSSRSSRGGRRAA